MDEFTIMLVVFVFAILGSSLAQNYNQLYAGFGPYFRQQSLSSGSRDSRSNRGPVLFPQNPPSKMDETSGVVVGASGYGFVPPNAAFFAYFY